MEHMKKIIMIVVVLGLLIGGFFIFNNYIYKEKQVGGVLPKDFKNATYVIDGNVVTLVDGVSEIAILPDSNIVLKTETRYFGNEVVMDLNADGRDDFVFLLTQNTGGTGLFYYVAGALNTEEGYVGTEAVFLGDRIAPQTTEKGDNGIVLVNYADRKPGEPFTAQPSVGKSIWLKLDIGSMQFGEVVQNFEGEADPSRMTLGMKKWVWISALYNDGREIVPKKTEDFTISFGNDGRFSATTDCNIVGGNYAVKDNQITFGKMISTKMYCESSQESEFTGLITNSTSFHFTSRGELILDLKFDNGTVTFR